MLRGQGTYLSDDEITRVVDHVGTDDPQFAGELMQLKTKDELEAAGGGNYQSRDELYDAAVDIVLRERRGSVSLLQRALGIGYGRAARLIDFMAEDGVVGQYNGAQAREVLISLEEWEARHREGDDAAVAAPPVSPNVATRIGGGDAPARLRRDEAQMSASVQPRRRNKITPDPDEPSDLEDDTYDEEEYEEDDGEATSVAGSDEDELDEDDADWDEEDDDDGEAEAELADDEEWDDEDDDSLDEEADEDDEPDEEESGEDEFDDEEEEESDEPIRVHPQRPVSRIGRRQFARRPSRK
jgi:S-DNA-T family DNA segregation ATPase FtsK/SpoIIIE